MECQIQADITPQSVQWLCNDQELVQSERVEMSFSEDVGLAHLTVHQVGPEDSGVYACVVVGEVTEPLTGKQVSKTITSTSEVTITGECTLSGMRLTGCFGTSRHVCHCVSVSVCAFVCACTVPVRLNGRK